VKGNDNPHAQMYEHHSAGCFVPECPFQHIWYLETLSTAINHQLSQLKFTQDEKLRLKNHTHKTLMPEV